MKKVITYGSFDLFHYGHQRLLERAKELGDYLIVGVTSDDYDKTRGKINLEQSLEERVAAVRATGLADLIIVESYDGQKINDIKKYNVDIFAIGSDWEGKFDYLKKYSEVVYLERTKGVSSSSIRSKKKTLNLGIIGSSFNYLAKIIKESELINGLKISGIYPGNEDFDPSELNQLGVEVFSDYTSLLQSSDAVYIKTDYEKSYETIKHALMANKSVLAESPICLSEDQCKELFSLAKSKNIILMEAIRTAYSTAYQRLSLLAEIGKIGEIVSVQATCTSLKQNNPNRLASLFEWGPNALLPVLQILGTNYRKKEILSRFVEPNSKEDIFTRINFVYDNAVGSVFVAEGAKSEGELIISGTKGYIYVPAPWWKTEYFEVRYENISLNRRYFYQLDGEGIRYELVDFVQAIKDKKDVSRIDREISMEICKIMEDFKNKKDLISLG